MKNLLSTTALVAGLVLGGAAFAQSAGPEFATTNNLDPASSQQYTWNVLINSGTDLAPVWQTTEATGTYAEYLAAVAATQAGGGDVRIEADSLALAGASTDAPGAAQASNSLLDNILADAEDLSASLSNVSQNLNNINGSIEVNTDRDYAGIAAGINALVGEYDGFGSFSTVNPNVYGVDLPGSLLAVLDPLVLELGNLSTTAIGTLQSGNMTGSFDASGIVNKVTSSAEGATTGANMLAETYGGIAQTVAMQNVSVNSGDINGSVDLILADVDAKVGSVATTAIGALQSGAMTATVDGAIGSVSHNSAALVSALVGDSTP
jgi:hypothetical protein